MDLRKLFASLTAVTVVASSFFSGVAYGQVVVDPEFDAAVDWMFENGMTKYSNSDDFMPYANLTREQATKFTDVYAMTNLCLEADADKACDFSDIPADPSLDEYVRLSCQLGLFNGSDGMFYPTDYLTKAQLLTVLVRGIREAAGEPPLSEDVTPRWKNYFDEARALGLTIETDVWALDRPVTRYEAALLLYRARIDDAECGLSSGDITDLLEDLFGDDDMDDDDDMDEGDDDDDMDDEDDFTQPTSDGTLEVSLSPTTPAGDTVPGLANIVVAEFELISVGEPVVLNSVVLTRFGIGNDDTVERVSLFLEDGTRLTNDRSFNSSDDEATLTLSPRLEVPTDDPILVQVLAEIGDAEGPNGASNQEFQIGIAGSDHVQTNGDVDGDFPIKANEFEVAGVNAPEIIIEPDGTLSDVELGEQQAEVIDFEIEGANNEDVYLSSLTFTDGESNGDDALENFNLVCDGEEIAQTEFMFDDTLNFSLDMFMIPEGQNMDCSVFADVIGEAGEQIAFYVDESIDVRGSSDFGPGIAVNVDNYQEGDAQVVDIVAGEVTLIEQPAPQDEITDGDDDVVLAEFDIDVNVGSELYIEDLFFDIVTDTNVPACDIDTLFEDFELFNATTNTTYDVDIQTPNCGSAVGTTCRVGEEGIDLDLPAGAENITLQLRADTVNDFADTCGAFDSDISVHVELDANPNNGDLEINEYQDDKQVTDIVPTFMSFETLDLVEPDVNVTELSLSDIDVVRGATDVLALEFQIETDEASAVFFNEIAFTDGGAGNLDTDHVSAVRLYRGQPEGTNSLLEAQGGFEIVAGGISFDDFDEVMIPTNSTQPFFVTLDIVDDPTITGDVIDLQINTVDIEDDDNDDIDNPTISSPGNRQITINDVGSLVCTFDTADDETDRPQIILGGTEADNYLGSWTVTADNEPVLIRDVQFESLTATNFVDAFDTISLFYEDGTELYKEEIVDEGLGAGVQMYLNEISGPDGGDFILEQGEVNLYVNLKANKIGDQEQGAEAGPFNLTMSIPEAEGEYSNEDLIPTACGGMSEEFVTRSVRISDLNFLDAGECAEGNCVASVLTEGQNKLSIFRVQADDWDGLNDDPADGGSLDILFDTITVTVNQNTGYVDLAGLTLTRIDTNTETVLTGTVNGDNVTFDLSGSALSNAELALNPTDEAVFLVEGDVSGLPADGSVQVSIDFEDLDSGNFTYSHDGQGAVLNTALYLDKDNYDGADIVQN